MSELRLTADALRAAFDRSFAEPALARHEQLDDLLVIRVSDHAYAVRVSELSGLHAGRAIVPVPSALPELLGLAAFRGALAPVYDLGLLLGHAPLHQPRWLMLARAPAAVALAFEAFAAHARVARRTDESSAEPARRPVKGAVEVGGNVYPVLSIASLLEALTQTQRSLATAKEP